LSACVRTEILLELYQVKGGLLRRFSHARPQHRRPFDRAPYPWYCQWRNECRPTFEQTRIRQRARWNNRPRAGI